MPDSSINFDCAADFYDATRGFITGQEAPAMALIAAVGGFTPRTHALEIGVGTGRIAVPLSAHVGRYTGIDISAGMMDKLRDKQNGANIQLARADALRLPFAADSFDAAVIVHVFHLVADPVQVARELARVLVPDGLALHCRSGFAEGLVPIRDAWDAATRPHRERNWRWEMAESLLHDQGWTEIATQTHKLPTTTRPREFLERAESRAWSSTWHMSDDQLAQGIAAIKAAITRHYDGDLDREVPAHREFTVTAYRRPA